MVPWKNNTSAVFQYVQQNKKEFSELNGAEFY